MKQPRQTRRSLRTVVAGIALVLGSTVTDVAGVGVGGVAPAAAASPGGLACQGVISSGGTFASLSVPAFTGCEIESPVTIDSAVTMGISSIIVVDILKGGSLTVNGSLTVGPDAVFNGSELTVEGKVVVHSESTFVALNSTVAGGVFAHDSDVVNLDNSDVGGPVVVQGGKENVGLAEARIAGPVSVTNTAGGNGALIIIATILGPFTFSNNEGDAGIGHNTIDGPATCSDNAPAPNTATGFIFKPGVIGGPVRGDQAATCVGVPGGV